MSGDNRNLVQAFVFESGAFAMAPLGSLRIDTGDTRYVGALMTSLALKTSANQVLPLSGFSSDSDAVPPSSNNLLLPALTENMVYDPATDTWNRVSGARTDTGGLATQATARALQTVALGYGFNGATFDRIRTASATNQALLGGRGILQAGQPGMWSVTSAPAIGVAPSATRAAAGVGTRHVITGFLITTNISNPVAPPDVFSIVSGAVTAAVVSGGAFSNPRVVSVSGLAVVCPDNTAVTATFSGVFNVTAFATISLYGYTAVD